LQEQFALFVADHIHPPLFQNPARCLPQQQRLLGAPVFCFGLWLSLCLTWYWVVFFQSPKKKLAPKSESMVLSLRKGSTGSGLSPPAPVAGPLPTIHIDSDEDTFYSVFLAPTPDIAGDGEISIV
jgi:hypothetical protein